MKVPWPRVPILPTHSQTLVGGMPPALRPSRPDCDPTLAADISVTFTVPDGWVQFESGENVFWQADEQALPPDGASFLIMRGSWLASDPCAEAPPDIAVGPTVDDFANALADHPLLDITAPVDVTLDGYSGKYVELQTPADLTECPFYRPWDPGIYAQGPGQRWRIWILDVDGIRVVIHTDDYAGRRLSTRLSSRRSWTRSRSNPDPTKPRCPSRAVLSPWPGRCLKAVACRTPIPCEASV